MLQYKKVKMQFRHKVGTETTLKPGEKEKVATRSATIQRFVIK